VRSKRLNLAAYDTDKISHCYLEVYDPVLAPWVDQEIRFLEVGGDRGGSLKFWRNYFLRGSIVGIDLKLSERFVPGERIQVFEGSEADERFLSEVIFATDCLLLCILNDSDVSISVIECEATIAYTRLFSSAFGVI
jgi:hypothetical protein